MAVASGEEEKGKRQGRESYTNSSPLERAKRSFKKWCTVLLPWLALESISLALSSHSGITVLFLGQCRSG